MIQLFFGDNPIFIGKIENRKQLRRTLNFRALEDNDVITLSADGMLGTDAGQHLISVEYSTNYGDTWTTYEISAFPDNPSSGIGPEIELNTDEVVYFRAVDDNGWFSGDGTDEGGQYASGKMHSYQFSFSKPTAAAGNVGSLIRKNNYSCYYPYLPGRCFYKLFYNQTNLITAPDLPATDRMGRRCFSSMFQGCTNLTTVPALPECETSQDCYMRMFEDCSSITTAPTIYGTTFATGSCYEMFMNCTSLVNTQRKLFATTFVGDCCWKMFFGCSSLDTAPDFQPNATMDNSFRYMYKNCTSLSKLPALHRTATNGWTSGCYQEMFAYCTSLRDIHLPMVMDSYGTLALASMFYGCENLERIEVDFTEWPVVSGAQSTYQPTYNWLVDVKSGGTFVCPQQLTIPEPRSTANVPSTWTIETK